MSDEILKADIQGSPRYEVIRQLLKKALTSQQVPQGVVLIEGHLAGLFGTSREPVRRALSLLHEEGLLRRFEGRGFLFAPSGSLPEPVRMVVTRELLGLHDERTLVDTRSAGEKIVQNLRELFSRAMVFGCYQIEESAAAEFYGTSRGVIRESLLRLRDQGLIEKEPYSQWLTGPLTACEVSEHFEIRTCLEPAALRKAGEELSVDWLNERVGRLDSRVGQRLSTAELEEVENDLHVRCLEPSGNSMMMKVLRQNQSSLIVTSLFYDLLKLPVDADMLAEHRLVYEMLLRKNWDLAANCLANHLEREKVRTLKRLKVLSVLPVPELPAFLLRK